MSESKWKIINPSYATLVYEEVLIVVLSSETKKGFNVWSRKDKPNSLTHFIKAYPHSACIEDVILDVDLKLAVKKVNDFR